MSDSLPTTECPNRLWPHRTRSCWMCGAKRYVGQVPKEVATAYRIGGRLAVYELARAHPGEFVDLRLRLVNLYMQEALNRHGSG